MSEIYPNFERNTFWPFYYVEFNRGNKENEFTLFKRHFMYSESDIENNPEIKAQISHVLFSNEVHPWNLFTVCYGENGSHPDKNWVKFMVDSLNEKSK